MQIPPAVLPLFIDAGWQPDRCVPVPPSIPLHHPAYEILAELGGLHIGHTGAGIECAASDLLFGAFDADELAGEYTASWSTLLGSPLITVAEVHNGHGWLFADGSGRCFGGSLIHDAFWLQGSTFAEALERLLPGRRARPMLRPDQESVDLYGETFTRGHPVIFEYR